jgi:hypothetical protein
MIDDAAPERPPVVRAGVAERAAVASTVSGDVRVGLRATRADADPMELFLGTTCGDVDVILAGPVEGGARSAGPGTAAAAAPTPPTPPPPA